MNPNIQKSKDALKSAFLTIIVRAQAFAPAVASLKWVVIEDDTKLPPGLVVPTACTDGEFVYVNPDFFSPLPVRQQVYLVIHETLHPLLNHTSRLRGWRPDIANIAADYEENNLLDLYVQEGNNSAFEHIPGGYADATTGKSFKGEAAEVIANKLLEDKELMKKLDAAAAAGSKMGNSCGEFIPAPSQAKADELTEKWQQVRAAVVNGARLAGNVSGAFIEAIESVMRPPVDLYEMLRRLMSELLPIDCGQRSDRRWLHDHGICIPDPYEERFGTVVLMRDTSGSISSTELEAALSCVEDTVARMPAKLFVVMDVDTRVAHIEELEPGDPVSREFYGRGGTDLRAGFDHIAEHYDDCRALVVFTDGETPFPDEAPEYPVIWIHCNPSKVHYPFGEVIDITEIVRAASVSI